MQKFRIILLSIFSLADLYTIYATIGYFIIGYNCPRINGATQTIFTGNYLMSVTFLLATIILTTLIIVISIKLKRNKKNSYPPKN